MENGKNFVAKTFVSENEKRIEVLIICLFVAVLFVFFCCTNCFQKWMREWKTIFEENCLN